MNIPEEFKKAETFHGLACFKQETARNVACAALAIVFRDVDSRDYTRTGARARSVLEDCAAILAPLGASGIEFVSGPSDEGSCAYVNLGDTYATTICYDADADTWSLESWGGWLEAEEEAHTFETGEDMCGYCGEWGDGSARAECCPSFMLCGSCGRCSSCSSKRELQNGLEQ